MGSQAGLVEKVEMIGELEIDVLLLPEMSRAERAGRAKKTNNFHHCRARGGEAAPSGEAAEHHGNIGLRSPRESIWKPQTVYNDGIYLVYTRHMSTYSIYLEYTWYIPVI